MDFARKQLEKYGWQEGKGLGRNEDGIAKPIKPKLKFDKCGVGLDKFEFTKNWCDQVYSMTLNNLQVVNNNGNIEMGMNSDYGNPSSSWKTDSLDYGSFLKTSTLTDGKVVNINGKVPDNANDDIKIRIPTDEELFAACGGRTTHKGARHGHHLLGKLSRLEKQEKMLLKKLKKCSLSEVDEKKDKMKNLEKKIRRINENKEKNKPYISVDTDSTMLYVDGNSTSPNSYSSTKKRKERKRVSFNETVTEYQTQDLNSSSHDLDREMNATCSTELTVVQQAKIKDENESSDSEQNVNVKNENDDEGIDCSDYDACNEKNVSGCTSKQQEVYPLESLTKKERKILKRKLKKQALGATARFVNACRADINENESAGCVGVYEKSIKRKHLVEPNEHENMSKTKKCHLECRHGSRKREKTNKQKRLDKQISKVADSLDKICSFSCPSTD